MNWTVFIVAFLVAILVIRFTPFIEFVARWGGWLLSHVTERSILTLRRGDSAIVFRVSDDESGVCIVVLAAPSLTGAMASFAYKYINTPEFIPALQADLKVHETVKVHESVKVV